MPSTPITTPDNTPHTDPIRVTIVLTEPPTTRFYAALHADGLYSASEVTQAVAAQLRRIHMQQEALIRVVTASPIAGRVVLCMQSALNAVVVLVVTEHLPRLRKLASVKGIYRDEAMGHEPPINATTK